MDSKTLVAECKDKMDKRLHAYDKELTRVRTGRASITMLDGIKVNYYGTLTPLNQVSTLTTPDGRTIAISPFEKSLIAEIEKSILKADLGLNPVNDGHVVRIPIPPLTEDRRKEIAKSLKKMGEEAKVAVRHIRRDLNEAVKKIEKAKEITEDESKKLEKEIQTLTDKYIKLVDDRTEAKEKEIMTI